MRLVRYLSGSLEMIISIVPILVMLIGLPMYCLSANPKLSEVGRLLFFCGLFWTVSALAHEMIRLG